MQHHKISFLHWWLLACVISVASAHAQATQPATGTTVPVLRNVVPLGSQTENSAQLLSKDILPLYPEILRRSGVQGEMRAQFVVDTTGRADTVTFKVLTIQIALGPLTQHRPLAANSNESYDLDDRIAKFAFTEAVRQAVALMRFTPATVGDKFVRQLVVMPFNFGLNH